MLYVFHVDAGKMLTFDMCTAMDSVQNLKEQIQQQHRIPAVSQVLLVSGGEMLLPQSRVCSYSAGTDTNPIFMFSTIVEPSNQPQPWPSIDCGPDTVPEMKEKVEQCRSLAANYSTVVRRNQLAQQFDEMARAELATCERLVHEQHLQQQGWAAVVANMEDLTVDFKDRCGFLENVFVEMFKKRDHYLQCLADFNDDLDKLANIPILPALTHNAAKPFHAFDDALGDNNNSFSKQTKSNETTASQQQQQQGSVSRKAQFTLGGDDETVKDAQEGGADPLPTTTAEDQQEESRVLTLLEWISQDEKQTSLRKMAEQCQVAMQKVNETEIERMRGDAMNVIKTAEQRDVKQIKGLELRLSGLDELMQEAKVAVKDQMEMAQGFQQNQNRVNNLGDPSILPDLCNSHEKQLNVMFANHKKLGNIKSRIFNSKIELGHNLLQRLKYVICIENKMNDLNDTLLFNHRNCLRLQRHMSIIEQIHMAPTVYATAVSEVVRRRHFSSAFLMWACDLAGQLLAIYNDECTKRLEFGALFDGHFLVNLFPGMEDMPPKYAVEAPSLFDSALPVLTKADLQDLSAKVSREVTKIEFPDLSAVIEFFQSRSGNQRSTTTTTTTATTAITTSGGERPRQGSLVNKILDVHGHLKDYERGFDSETDTEEYEKVGQSPVESAKRKTGRGSGSGSAKEGMTVSTQTTTAEEEEVAVESKTDTSTSTVRVETQNSETLTEENASTRGEEVERLKRVLSEMNRINSQSFKVLKQEMMELQTDSRDHRSLFIKEFETLSEMSLRIKRMSEHQSQQLIKQTMDHEIEMNDIRQNLEAKCQHIQELMGERDRLEGEQTRDREKYDDVQKSLEAAKAVLCAQVDKLESRLAEALAEREKVIAGEKDKLNREYNYKLEILRSRYKLMTSMEQSPSETSLEKIERQDVFELSGECPTLTQSMVRGVSGGAAGGMPIRGSLGSDRFEGSLPTLVSGSPRSPSSRSQDFFRRIMDEKENQLDHLRSHVDQLTKEADRYKQTITDLMETVNKDGDVVGQLEAADRERKRLECELEAEKCKRVQMEQSFSVAPRMDASQSEVSKREFLINLSSCAVGSYVLVVYNSVHNHYVIMQDSSTLFFLHCSSYEALKLPQLTGDTIPSITSCVGKVEHKEYCVAKKDENRYKVPRGMNFYRVKVRPRSPGREGKSKSSLSRSASTTDRSEFVVGTVTSVGGSGASRTTSVGNLTSSFAQTELPLNAVAEETAKDMIDSGMQASVGVYKERNISVTEEEEEEPPMMATSSGDDSAMVERKERYMSVSEADDVMVDAIDGSAEEVELMLDTDDTGHLGLFYPDDKLKRAPRGSAAEQPQFYDSSSDTEKDEEDGETESLSDDEYRSLE